jgi:hypothetical protein
LLLEARVGFSASASKVIGDAVTTSARPASRTRRLRARGRCGFDLLPDELRRSGDDDLVVAVELADTRRRIVEPDLDELELDLGVFRDRRGRAKRVELPLTDDVEVVEMHVTVR